MRAKGLIQRLLGSYIFVLTIALFVGIVFSDYAVHLAPYSTLFLAIIFFFSALKIDLKEAAAFLKDRKMLAVTGTFMLILFPVIAYFVTLATVPELAVAFLILAAMPCGMTAPLLSEIVGGKQSLALVLTIMTSLLAPITVPLMIKLLAGAHVEVSFWIMFLSLAKIIFIPFVLANFIKYFWSGKIKATYYTFKPISIVLLGLLIMGIVAKQASSVMNALQGNIILYIVLLFVFFGFVHAVGYFAAFWRNKKERVTVTVCLSYMNFTLAIYLAGEFFTEPNIVVPVILSVLPWSLLIIPFGYLVRRLRLVSK